MYKLILYTGMWMSDKPLIQQRLAVDLAALVDTLHPEIILPFLDAFWKTMAREWNGIDVLRYFILLVSTNIHYTDYNAHS